MQNITSYVYGDCVIIYTFVHSHSSAGIFTDGQVFVVFLHFLPLKTKNNLAILHYSGKMNILCFKALLCVHLVSQCIEISYKYQHFGLHSSPTQQLCFTFLGSSLPIYPLLTMYSWVPPGASLLSVFPQITIRWLNVI